MEIIGKTGCGKSLYLRMKASESDPFKLRLDKSEVNLKQSGSSDGFRRDSTVSPNPRATS